MKQNPLVRLLQATENTQEGMPVGEITAQEILSCAI